eukprot:GAHX01000249.1.p1 GENE.GAHX01000249.1~~GAHX01000249.1.p1  ORF type:complete len:274 (+),score=59.13 GAHX01000249.1:34-855(+)
MDKIEKLKNILYQAFPLNQTPAWDNVGHVINSNSPDCSKILVTNDVTHKVIDEAIEKGIKFIISYHPPYLKVPKEISEDTHPSSLIFKMIKNSIDLFVLHTSVDLMKDSVNENLFEFVKDNIKDMEIIDPVDKRTELGFGRKVTLTSPVSFKEMINKLKTHHKIKGLKYALPMPCDENKDVLITTISSICGSGFDIIKKAKGKIDAVITGELYHHQVLELQQNGIAVVLLGHSVSERHFIPKFRNKLAELFKDLGNIEVIVSEADQYNMEYLV